MTHVVVCHVQKEQAEAAREKFMSSEGDHITLLNIFRAYKTAGGNKVCTEVVIARLRCGLHCAVQLKSLDGLDCREGGMRPWVGGGGWRRGDMKDSLAEICTLRLDAAEMLP